MSEGTPASSLLSIPVMALTGLAFGLMYFRMLRRTVDLLVDGRGWLWPAALTAGRILGTFAALALVVQLGAIPLLAAVAGFSGARVIALRTARRT